MKEFPITPDAKTTINNLVRIRSTIEKIRKEYKEKIPDSPSQKIPMGQLEQDPAETINLLNSTTLTVHENSMIEDINSTTNTILLDNSKQGSMETVTFLSLAQKECAIPPEPIMKNPSVITELETAQGEMKIKMKTMRNFFPLVNRKRKNNEEVPGEVKRKRE